jgi:uncharacterized protein (TIGR03435 family)
MAGLGAIRFNIAAKPPEGWDRNQFPAMLQALLADRFKLAVHRGTREQAIYVLVLAKGGLKLKEAAPEAAAAADSTSTEITLIGGIQTRTARVKNPDGSGDTIIMSNPRMGTVRETESPGLSQRWEAPSMTLEGLADLLDRVGPWDPPVFDETGLHGRYQVELQVSLKDALGPRPGAAGDRNAMESVRMEREQSFVRAFNDGLRKLGLQLVRRREPLDTVVVDHVEKMPIEN